MAAEGNSPCSWGTHGTIQSDMGQLRLLLREELQDALSTHHKRLVTQLQEKAPAHEGSFLSWERGSNGNQFAQQFKATLSVNKTTSAKSADSKVKFENSGSANPLAPTFEEDQALSSSAESGYGGSGGPHTLPHGRSYHKALSESVKKQAYVQSKKGLDKHHSTAHFAESMVKHEWFERFFGFLILTNSIFIGAQIEYQASMDTATSTPAWALMNNMYTVLFLVELILRLVVDWRQYLCSRGSWASAGLDVFVVVTSLAEFFMQFINDGYSGLRNFSVLRVVRVMRVFRILRAVRTMSFFRDFRILLNSIYGCLKSLAWAMCLFFIVMYLFGVVFTQTIHDHIVANGRDIKGYDRLERFYGTLFTSMFTLFKSMSGGISWHEVVEPLFDVHGYLVGVFVAYISFVVFAVMNVVTGVFCENAIRTAQKDQEEVINQQLAEKRFYTNQLSKLFEAIDENHTGTITIQEFESYMENPRVVAYLESLDINTKDMWSFFQLLDTDGTLTIELEEFVEGILKLKGPAKSIDVALVLHKHQKASGSLSDFEKAMKKEQDQFISKLETTLYTFLQSEEELIRIREHEMVHLMEGSQIDVTVSAEASPGNMVVPTSVLRSPLTTVRTPRSPRSSLRPQTPQI